MFYWMKRSSGGSDTLDRLGNMSKAEILRGIVTEKLSTAAQEILAVVERTVAGYEEEASGFRREIERQKRQLELLLQPRVKLERRDLNPDGEDHEVVVLREEKEEEEQHTQRSAVEDTGSLGLLWFGEEEDGDGDDGVDEEQQLSAASSRQRREDLKDPDYQITSRVISPRARSDRRKPGRPRLSDTQSHLDLRICILEDSQTDVLSNTVFRKYPVQQVRCPRGLQEADFLDLLRSTFPQLADQKPFDVFTSDRSRRLQPLRAKTLTPEEICWSIRLMGSRRTANSALYIRLKTGEDPQSSSDNLHPLQRTDDPPSVSATTSADETDTRTRLSSPRVQSERRKRGRPRIGEEPTHHLLRVCMLEDSQSDLLSNKVLMKSSVQEVRCPRGLQEADFLDLLRSAIPQLEGDDKQFDVFKSDSSRRLHRVKVKTMTPEEIFRNTKSSCADKTLLYIRLKTGEEEEEEEELRLVQRNDEVTSDSPSSAAVLIRSDGADLSASPVQHVEGNGADVLSSSSASQQQKVGTKEADDGDAAESQVESSDDDKDGDEALDKDDDWKPDPELGTPKMRRKRGARASGVEGRLIGSDKIPCKVCGVWYRILGSLIKHAWSHLDEAQSICGVCGERFESTEELKGHLKKYQKTHECSYCRKSFSTITGLKCHTTLHTGNRPFKCDVCNKSFPRMSSLSIHRWVHVEDKPHKCHICPKAFGLKAQLRAHIKVHTGRDKYHCNLCSKSFYDLRSLTRHKATHSGERRYSCGVCGKSFKLPGTLKSHEKTHTERERPYLCHICCKTFISNCSLTAHMKTHSSERPFICIICSKGFISNGRLKGHMLMHTGEAPYGCSECGRFFKHKSHLNNHVRSHLGIKLFVCTVCGKACSRQEHLTVHMRTHNGERPYQCSVCDKAFTQSHCLKTHMKSHQGEENPFLNASSS
ncbi:zinc finger protein 37-like isoform X2 [Epinephelus fuscoguttatus]|uniref:zinc finger protein 37-like isoform X2 n=1 Tax=Epinephelus fuscoguttatus TaxID=293821 RepID=UPI0020D1E8C0|nr:zinc finger protein 37-like isoform X2 [Epinephelus fuscoguttatus]